MTGCERCHCDTGASGQRCRKFDVRRVLCLTAPTVQGVVWLVWHGGVPVDTSTVLL